MKISKFVFLLILLQVGQIAVASESRDIKNQRLYVVMQESDRAFKLIKTDGLTRYFSILLQDTVEVVVGERVGGNYDVMKAAAVQSKELDQSDFNLDVSTSDEIRCSIKKYVMAKCSR